MKRLSNEQRNFQDAMSIILDLYSLVKESVIESNLPEPIIKLIAKLYYKTVPNFSPCMYFTETKLFRFRLPGETIDDFTDSFKEFLALIDSIRKNIAHQNYTLFEIIEGSHTIYVNHHINKLIEYQKSSDKSKLSFEEYLDKDIDKLDHQWLAFDSYKRGQGKSNYIEGEPSVRIINNCDYQKTYELMKVALNDSPPYREAFKIFYHTDPREYRRGIDVKFNFIGHFRDGDNDDEVTGIVTSPGFSESTKYGLSTSSFHDILRFILVKYIYLFGSFKHLKVCKKCGKLFLEKKYGYGIFCNVRCRVNYHVESEQRNIFNCRARQNAWLERELRTQRDTVLKDDCKMCKNEPIGEKIPKGGLCKIILGKNIVALNKKEI